MNINGAITKNNNPSIVLLIKKPVKFVKKES